MTHVYIFHLEDGYALMAWPDTDHGRTSAYKYKNFYQKETRNKGYVARITLAETFKLKDGKEIFTLQGDNQ